MFTASSNRRRPVRALLLALALQSAFIPTASTADNRTPGISSGEPPSSVDVGSLWTFMPYAWDHDGDTLVFSVRNKPSWMTLVPETGRVRGTPTAAQVGVYRDIVLSVSDGAASSSLPPFTVAVNDANGTPPADDGDPEPTEGSDPDNRAPSITGTPPTSVTAGELYTFLPYAWDLDRDPITFSVANKPVWMTVDSSSGRVRGTPTSSQAGVYRDVRITVSDGSASKSLPAFDLTVLSADGTPPPSEPEPAPEPSPTPPPPTDPIDSGDLFVSVSSPGRVPVTLHPGPTARHGQPVTVAFGVPFPRGLVKDLSQLRLIGPDGAELPSHVVELARWRVLGQSTSAQSIRAALFYVELAFSSSATRQISVEFGRSRTRNLGAQPAPDALWVGISKGTNPDEYPAAADVREPAVYATLPADWLGAALLRTRTQPILLDDGWRWFDEALTNYAATAVNDVGSSVSSAYLIDYANSAEPWLFDRAMTLFGVYVRTGELRWLRHAHRAAQFYAGKVTSRGAFALRGSDDLKYSYGQSLLLDLMLTGDRRLTAPIERVATLGTTFEETYSSTLNFWTERHQAYALLAALSAWEATGKTEHASRAMQVARASFTAARQPANGWAAQGCILHTIRQHEGDADDRPICSPWMSALLAEAVWRYHLMSPDSQALAFLADLGMFVARYGIRELSAESSQLAGRWAPWYLASKSVKYTDSGAWGDLEHTCDVAGLTARGAWAARALGRSSSEIDLATSRLVPTCRANLASWHRTTDVTRPEWRLQPPRKFSWWFGSTLDLPWFDSARR